MKTISVAEAQQHRVCRICGVAAGPRKRLGEGGQEVDAFVLNFGREHAHRSCLELEARIAELEKALADEESSHHETLHCLRNRERENAELRAERTYTTEPPTESGPCWAYASHPQEAEVYDVHYGDGELLAWPNHEDYGIPLAEFSHFCPILKPFEPEAK